MQKIIFERIAVLFAALFCFVAMGFRPIKQTDEGYSSDFRGARIPEKYSSTVTYDHKESTSVEIEYGIPYYNLNSLNNKCANLAGAVVIGYYDRFFENLFPNFKSYTQLGTYVKYKGNSAASDAVIDTLYDLMNTDLGKTGTDFTGFNAGMRTYVENQGYTYGQQEVFSNDLKKYQVSVDAKKPVVIFATGFSLIENMSEADGEDQMIVQKYKDKHVMVGYGYRVDKYYDKNNKLIDTYTYLTVYNGGMQNKSIKYLWLNKDTTIDHAISITIS